MTTATDLKASLFPARADTKKGRADVPRAPGSSASTAVLERSRNVHEEALVVHFQVCQVI